VNLAQEDPEGLHVPLRLAKKVKKVYRESRATEVEKVSEDLMPKVLE